VEVMDSTRRIQKEVEKMMAEPVPGVEASPQKGNLFHWRAQLAGPEESVYEGGNFELDMKLPLRYPLEPPNVVFRTRIFHPNVSDRGEICLDVLKTQWSPALTLHKVLLSVSSLLTDPNFADPLNSTAAALFRQDPKSYDSKCREMTRRFAMPVASRTKAASTSNAKKGQKREARAAGLDGNMDSLSVGSAASAMPKAMSRRALSSLISGTGRAKAAAKSAAAKAKAKAKSKAKARPRSS